MKIELLSPAKNFKIGKAAIDAGADAVYIGAFNFGARKKAGNNLKDIEKLINYAHIFGVKVYITLNTILYDDEMQDVQNLIYDLKKIKVDALIIQDMGLLELDLKDIPIIASTQMDNFDIEKIKFLEKIGFKRVILGREISLSLIEKIKKNTDIELEAFVNGALCVSYSGRCYLSEYLSKKSGNRGECIQPCRLPYSLIDRDGKVLIKDKYLLSLKDLNLSKKIKELIDRGISSFKIEGRMKDIDYVINTTYFYRKIIDKITKVERSSYGKVFADFEPDLDKTFNRGFTDYFLEERQKDILAINSPKSIGKFMGQVKDKKDYFILDRKHDFNLGDGICFFNKDEKLEGSSVSKIDGDKIYLNKKNKLRKGDLIYRNFDIKFDRKIRQEKVVERKIGLDFSIKEIEKGLRFEAVDERGYLVFIEIEFKKQLAEKKELMFDVIEKQFKKLGNTIFYFKELKIDFYKEPLFINISILNEIRRELILKMEKKILENYKNEKSKFNKNNRDKFYLKKIDSEFNVKNKLAENFYKKHGVKEIDFNFKHNKLMTTKHCLKYYLGECGKNNLKEPLYLINQKKQKFLLKFNCKKCEMEIYRDDT